MTWGEIRKAEMKIAVRCSSCGREPVVDAKRIASISGEASLAEALALLKCRECGTHTIEARTS